MIAISAGRSLRVDTMTPTVFSRRMAGDCIQLSPTTLSGSIPPRSDSLFGANNYGVRVDVVDGTLPELFKWE